MWHFLLLDWLSLWNLNALNMLDDVGVLYCDTDNNEFENVSIHCQGFRIAITSCSKSFMIFKSEVVFLLNWASQTEKRYQYFRAIFFLILTLNKSVLQWDLSKSNMRALLGASSTLVCELFSLSSVLLAARPRAPLTLSYLTQMQYPLLHTNWPPHSSPTKMIMLLKEAEGLSSFSRVILTQTNIFKN